MTIGQAANELNIKLFKEEVDPSFALHKNGITEIMELDTNSVCGQDCLKVLRAARDFLDAVPNALKVMPEVRQQIENAVSDEIAVLYFG